MGKVQNWQYYQAVLPSAVFDLDSQCEYFIQFEPKSEPKESLTIKYITKYVEILYGVETSFTKNAFLIYMTYVHIMK